MRAPRALLLSALLLALSGGAWPWRPHVEEPEPVDTVEPATAAPPPPTFAGDVFAGGLPLDPGPLPAGLANLSAQGCASCHPVAHASWATSAHSAAPPPTQLVPGASPACDACHLPLAVQWDQLVTFDGGLVEHPVGAPNPAFDATLSLEGVTCAACHVRDGEVLTPTAVTAAPHPTRLAPDLLSANSCAPCHQLTWPGADMPLYDTVGEWQRSAQAAAGITCQDCHMRPGVRAEAASHQVALPAARAVSLLVRFAAVELHRGGDPLDVQITLQNTGAGHAFPTGSPYRAVSLRAELLGADDLVIGEPHELRLGRTLSDGPPWRTESDTRLQAGATLEDRWQALLPSDGPAGPWWLRVQLLDQRGPTTEPQVLVSQRFPLRVD